MNANRCPRAAGAAAAADATGPAVIGEALEARTHFAATTNDPYYSQQYALANTAVADAWSTTRGSAAVVVADIDTGADYVHRDLHSNIWINQAEIPSAVRSLLSDTDADGRISFYDLNATGNRPRMTDGNRNGYIDAADLLRPRSQGGWEDGVNGQSNANDRYTDDIVGWDFAENDNKPLDDSGKNGGHGTHTAGIIGATGNNGVGISGVIQRVSMMIVRIFADNGSAASSSRIAESIRYAADSAARVMNASWGGTYGNNGDALYGAIQYAGTKNSLFVTAAGNSRWNIDSAAHASYPAEYDLANIVVVGATDASSRLASFSSYGSTKVDVTAPGATVYSTVPGSKYAKKSGTSMATPVVSGAAALMLAANPGLSAAQLKQRLIDGSDESSALNNRSVSDGELNVYNTLRGVSGTNLPTTTNATTSDTGGGANSTKPKLFGGPFGRVFFSGSRSAASDLLHETE